MDWLWRGVAVRLLGLLSKIACVASDEPCHTRSIVSRAERGDGARATRVPKTLWYSEVSDSGRPTKRFGAAPAGYASSRFCSLSSFASELLCESPWRSVARMSWIVVSALCINSSQSSAHK